MHFIMHYGLWLIFQQVGTVWRFLQKIFWWINGTQRLIELTFNPINFYTSAQVLKVRLTYAFDPIAQRNTTRNFLLTHQNFVNPHYVLRDEISLFYVNSREAVFVEAPSGIETWRNIYSGFHKVAQHKYAVNIIRMPLHAFYKLADELGDPKETLIFYYFTPRSGSTVLCKVLEESGVCVTFSEANTFHCGGHNTHYCFGESQTKTSLQAQVRIHCKPRKQYQKAFLFKIHVPLFGLIDCLSSSFPRAKFLFQYRNGLSCVTSVYKMVCGTPRFQIHFQLPVILFIICPKLTKKKIKVAFHGISQNQYISHILGTTKHFRASVAVFRWAHAIHLYNNHRSPKMAAIKYEDLITNPTASISSILKFLDLPAQNTEGAVQGLKGDSQSGTTLSKENLSLFEMPEDALESSEVFDICHYYGTPKLTDECRLKNTITIPEKRKDF